MKANYSLGIAAVAALLSAGCNGFPQPTHGEIEWAESPEKYVTYQPSPVTEPITAGNQQFAFIAGPVTDIPATAFGGAQATAAPLWWDQPPFDQLFVVSDRYVYAYGLLY